MPSEDNLHDLLQIDVPDLASSEEEHAPPRDADLLNSLRVASPCDASWEEMEGDELVRFCQYCQKNVYNLSGMSRREAAAFVRETEGRLCVRFYRRQDGTLLTDNCPVGWRAARRWLLARMAAVFGLLGTFAPFVAERARIEGNRVMGSPAAPNRLPPPPQPVHLGKVAPLIMPAPYREATPRRRHRHRRSRHGRRR
jgi:hypothetical protein